MVHVFSLSFCVLPLNKFHESVFFPVWHDEILLQALISFIFSISFLYFLIAFSCVCVCVCVCMCVPLVPFPFPSSLSLSQMLSISLYLLTTFFAFLPLNCVYSVIFLSTVPKIPLMKTKASFCRQQSISCTQKRNSIFCTEGKFFFL